MDPIIEFQGVSKRFTLSHDRPRSMQEALLRLLRPQRQPVEEFWALREVSFGVQRGQTVGLIGTNGSGKSTALKLMAGILQPTSGSIRVGGRISALLELGSGMHPDLSGRENIYLNGSLLGIPNREMETRAQEIIRFAELERFIDMPVKHYSSGMYMRLGFSVAIHTRPDILLLDEVLTVGDQSFQSKCIDRIYEMKKRGTTIVMVSHGLEQVRDLCDELVWLKDGVLAGEGSAATILPRYLRDIYETGKVAGQGAWESDSVPEQQRWGTRDVEIRAVRLRNAQNQVGDTFLTNDALTIELDYFAHQRVEDPMFGLALHHVDGTHISGPNNKLAGIAFAPIEGEGTVRYTIPALPLLPGSYEVTVSAYDATGAHAYDVHWRAYPFHVSAGGTAELYGLFHIPAAWSHHSTQPTPEPLLAALV